MKNKKPIILVLILSMLMILTGCGASSKQSLINHYEEISNQKNVKETFKVKFNKLEMPTDSKTDKSSQQIIEVIKDSTITGEVYSDSKSSKGTVKLNTMNKSVPLEFVGNDAKVYVGTDFYNSLFQLMESFGMTPPKYDFSQLSGKYVDLIALMNESGKISSNDKEALTKSFNGSQQSTSAALKEIIDTLPKDAITKKDGIITATLHKDDVKKTIEIYNEYLKKHKNVDDKPLKQSDIDKFISEFKVLDFVIHYDPKASTLEYTITMQPTEGGEAEIEVNTKSEKYEGKIEMPSEDKVVSPDDFTKAIGEIISGS